MIKKYFVKTFLFLIITLVSMLDNCQGFIENKGQFKQCNCKECVEALFIEKAKLLIVLQSRTAKNFTIK